MDVGQRLEDESADGHSWVGKDEGGGVYLRVASIKDIEVERSWGVLFSLDRTPEIALEDGETVQEILRLELGFDLNYGIEKRG